MNLLGIDIGTTGCKVSILSLSGKEIAGLYQEYPKTITQKNYQEIDPLVVWEITRNLISSCLRTIDKNSIAGIGVSSFGESFVPLDKHGKVLHNAILYTDSRGDTLISNIENSIPKNEFLMIAGTYPGTMYSLAKILWIKENHPAIYEEIDTMLPLDSYILYRLGSEPIISYSQAARTCLFDVVNKTWSETIITKTGLDISKLAKIVKAGSSVGEVSSIAADICGLREGTKLIVGGQDQQCCSLGMGVAYPGMASASLGSVESINPIFDRPILNSEMADNYFSCVPYLFDDLYITYAFSFTAGRLFKWYRDTLGADTTTRAKKQNVDVYDLLIDEMAGDSGELMMLPYFSGAATPYMDHGVKGMITGLDLNTDQNQLTRALLEGITFESMVNVERLLNAGVRIDTLRVTGGLARNPKFLQLKADMMGIPLSIVKNEQAGTVGVAMLVGIETGLFASLDEALKNMVEVGRSFEPDLNAHEKYLGKFENYKRLYPAIKDIYRI